MENPDLTLAALKEFIEQHEQPASQRMVRIEMEPLWVAVMRTRDVGVYHLVSDFLGVPVVAVPDMVGGRIIYADGHAKTFAELDTEEDDPMSERLPTPSKAEPVADITSGTIVWLAVVAFFLGGLVVWWLLG